MKKGVIVKIFFTAIIFAFLLSGIFAVAPAPGTCAITTRAECPESTNVTGTHILMGLSSLTNAHGEFPDLGTYSNVLCCGFGDGVNDTECTSTNTLIKLSSSTNAHAESPLGTSYNLVKVCYEDLTCEHFTDNCGTGAALSYPIGIVSLSATTNAHVGGINDYPTKICCGSPLYAGCIISEAEWNVEEAVEGQQVYLNVLGNDACSGKTISFKVNGASEEVQSQPISVSFTGAIGLGTWAAEHQSGGFLGLGDADYYFNASLLKNPLVIRTSNEPEMLVAERDDDYCAAIDSCDDYANQFDCEGDESICDVSEQGSIPGIDCDSDNFVCGCSWNNETDSCGFGYTEITEETCGTPVVGEGCNFGCTLCHNAIDGNYCHVGNSCPSGENPVTNSDGTCDFGEGCVSPDCQDGEQDSCASGYYCMDNKCSSILPPITLNLGNCKITQDITKGCDEEPVGYKIATLTTEWTGSADDPHKADCDAKNGQEVRISCPAQVALPFFDYIGIITTVLAIAGIYVSMVLRKRFKKAKENKNKK